jgi:hypothetical protein
MANATKASALGHDDLICPRCTKRARGRVCSQCGSTLSIAPTDVKEMAATRLIAVGYSRASSPADESAAGMVAARYFTPWNAAVLACELTSAHIAEVVVIADAADVPLDQLRGYLDDFPTEMQVAQAALGPTEISIRLVLIAPDTEHADTLRSMLPAPVKRVPIGPRARLCGRKQAATLKWRTAILNVQRAVVHQRGVSRVDAVARELRVAARQARDSATEEHSAGDDSSPCFVKALMGGATNCYALSTPLGARPSLDARGRHAVPRPCSASS